MRLITDVGHADDQQGTTRAVIYSRQSKASLTSIKEQDDECLADAEDLGLTIVDRYSDLVGASSQADAERPDWDRLLLDLRSRKFDVLILWESSRGDRQADMWLALLKLCRARDVKIRVTSNMRTYDLKSNPGDWKSLAVEGIEAQFETDRLGLRVQRALRSRAQKGRPHAKTPFGYVRKYDPVTRAYLGQEPDEELRRADSSDPWSPAGIVRQIFTDLHRGVSVNEVVRKLNARRIPIPRFAAIDDGRERPKRKYNVRGEVMWMTPAERWSSGRWTQAVVRHVVSNAAHIGKVRRYRRLVAEEAWDSLVDADVFQEVNDLLADPNRRSTTDARVRYLISCIATCARCGGKVTFLKPTGKAGRARILDNAGAYRCSEGSCAAVPAPETDQFVTAKILLWLTCPDIWQVIRTSSDGPGGVVAEARSRIAALTKEFENFQREVRALPAAQRSAQLSVVAEMEMNFRQEIAQAEAEALRVVPAAVRRFVGLPLEQAEHLWSSLGLDEQRQVIRTVATVTISPAGKGRRNVPLEQRVHVREVLTARFIQPDAA